jgi:hypothetical protein
MVGMHLKSRNQGTERIATFPDRDGVLDHMIVEHQKPTSSGNIDKAAVHARHNSHRSWHVPNTSFKNKKRSAQATFGNECRAHLPATKKQRTEVEGAPMNRDGSSDVP